MSVPLLGEGHVILLIVGVGRTARSGLIALVTFILVLAAILSFVGPPSHLYRTIRILTCRLDHIRPERARAARRYHLQFPALFQRKPFPFLPLPYLIALLRQIIRDPLIFFPVVLPSPTRSSRSAASRSSSHPRSSPRPTPLTTSTGVEVEGDFTWRDDGRRGHK